MLSYKDLGLVNTKIMFEKAYKEHYAVPAFNFISIEQINAIFDACMEKSSPLILLASPNLVRQIEAETVAYLAKANIERMKRFSKNMDVALHLDHGMKYEDCVFAIENGFSSVMIDGSSFCFDENVRITKEVVEYAHKHDATVEAELGSLSGNEEGHGSGNESIYTNAKEACEFIRKTGADSLAVSIGTSHGLVKIKHEAGSPAPILKYQILNDIDKEIKGYPLVLHGASSISKEYIKMINDYGGEIEESSGIDEDQVSKAAKMSVCKVNIASDGWIAALALTRKILSENKKAIDSRVFTLPVRKELKKLYQHKIDIFGSANKS